jgi:hypothetical protein
MKNGNPIPDYTRDLKEVEGQNTQATWADGMTWLLPLPNAETSEAVDDAAEKKGACQLFKENLDEKALVLKVVNHKNRGKWLAIFHGSTQVCQLHNFKMTYWDEAVEVMTGIVKDYHKKNIDNVEAKQRKDEWLQGKFSTPVKRPKHEDALSGDKQLAPKVDPKPKPKADPKPKPKAKQKASSKPKAAPAAPPPRKRRKTAADDDEEDDDDDRRSDGHHEDGENDDDEEAEEEGLDDDDEEKDEPPQQVRAKPAAAGSRPKAKAVAKRPSAAPAAAPAPEPAAASPTPSSSTVHGSPSSIRQQAAARSSAGERVTGLQSPESPRFMTRPMSGHFLDAVWR